MKTLITFVPIPEVDELIFPLNIYLLASILEQHGHDVKLIPASHFHTSGFFHSDRQEQVISDLIQDIDVLGLSANTGNWGSTIRVIHLAKRLRPDLPIVLGGIHGSYFDTSIIQRVPVDFILRGEADHSFPMLLQAIRQRKGFEHIPGLTYRTPHGVERTADGQLLTSSELEALPPPRYDLYPNENDWLPLESSRGCKFGCTFCSVLPRGKWRSLSVDHVVRRVFEAAAILQARGHKKKHIMMTDDCMTADPARALAILNQVKEANQGIKFFFESRARDLLQPGFLEKIPMDVVESTQIGVETGYDEGFAMLGKGLTLAELYECARRLNAHGVPHVRMSYIIGFPWETREQIMRTLDCAAELSIKYDNILAQMNWLIPMPSELWKKRAKYGIALDDTVFDDPYYLSDLDTFFQTHPTINEDLYWEVQKRCKEHVIASQGRFFFNQIIRPHVHTLRKAWNRGFEPVLVPA